MVDLHNIATDALNAHNNGAVIDTSEVSDLITLGDIPEVETKEVHTYDDNSFVITDDDLRTVMPDLSKEAFQSSSSELRKELIGYRKNLVIQEGFTREEANEAAKKRLNRKGKEINDRFLTDNPVVGIVHIDKSASDKVEFTPEEKEKLVKTKAIKLVLVEDEDLRTIDIVDVDRKDRATYLKNIEGLLSSHSVPLPITGDYLTFKGTQIIQALALTKDNNESVTEMISRKASLIYDRLHDGSLMKKYSDKVGRDTKTVLTYDEFVNTVRFHDLDLCLFAIYTASQARDNELPMACPKCKYEFRHEYHIRNLLSLDDLSDYFKSRMDAILKHKANVPTLTRLKEAHLKVRRYKSPFTGNIFDISSPTIAKALKIYGVIDQDDTVAVYKAFNALFINCIHIYDDSTGKYLKISESDDNTDDTSKLDDTKLLLDAIEKLPQDDMTLLVNLFKEMVYEPKFVLRPTCPKCAAELTNVLDIDDLVFLIAQDTTQEILYFNPDLN